MSFAFRIILILASLMTTLYIVRKIRYSKLQIEYAIFWIILSFLLILISIFPVLVTIPTNIIGMQAPVNFVFLVIIFILLIKAFMQTIEHSQLENKLNDLAQKIAIDEKISRDRQKDMETADSIEKMKNEDKVK